LKEIMSQSIFSNASSMSRIVVRAVIRLLTRFDCLRAAAKFEANLESVSENWMPKVVMPTMEAATSTMSP
jgi:hypothetical protein